MSVSTSNGLQKPFDPSTSVAPHQYPVGDDDRNHAPRSARLSFSVFATLLSFGTSAVLVAVSLTSPILKSNGPYDAVQRTVYTTVVTVISTIVTAGIMDQLRRLLLLRVDKSLDSSRFSSRSVQQRTNSLWKTILGLGAIKDQLSHKYVRLTLLLGALITTSINAGFTATTATRKVTFHFNHTSGDPTIMARSWPTLPQGCGLNWKLPNGSYYCSWVWNGASPQHKTWKLMQGININSPQLFAYEDQGVAVQPSAIGASVTLYDPNIPGYGLRELMQKHDWDISSTSVCAPVMVRNPVKCRQGGKITFTEYNGATNMWVKSGDGKCSTNKTGLRPVSEQPVYMLKKICMGQQIGQAKIILGAANSNYAQWVAASISEVLSPKDPQQLYSVECDIDASAPGVWEYRNLTFSLNRNSGNKSSDAAIAASRILSSDGPCNPQNDTSIGDPLFATTSTGAYFALYEDGAAGWSQSLIEVVSSTGDYGKPAAESIRRAPFALNDSSNALEDVIALMGAFSASRLVLTSSLTESVGTAQVVFTRIGPGKIFAIAYAAVPFLVGITLVWLLVMAEVGKNDYSSADLLDMIRFGMNASRTSVMR